MEALATALMLWLCANFDLPASSRRPTITTAPAAEIVAQRYGALTAEQRNEVLALAQNAAAANKAREVVAIYNAATATITLPEGWTGSTPAELSVLVHELVHFIQHVSDIRYECPGAREALAYAAQDKWLSLFGRSLSTEFDIDAFTLKVSTTCGF